MSRNKYQRRRGMRPSTTAASAVQSELFQHPVQHPQTSSSSSDVGREAARQIKEHNNPNTRFIDKPDATTNKNVLRQAQNQQQAASRSVQRQVLGEASTASLKPSGRYSAPPVPPRQTMQLVAKGGGIRVAPVPAFGANLAAGVAAYAIERAAQPALEYLGEKLARGLYEAKELITGDTDGVTFDEMQDIFRQVKQNVEMQKQQGNFPTPNQIEDQVEELRRQMSEMGGTPYRRFTAPEPGSSLAQFSRSQLRTIHDAPTVDEKAELIRRFKEQNLRAQVTTPKPSAPPQKLATPEPVEKPIEPQFDERNREYQIRRAALGGNPTKEEMNAVVAYGLEQHRINFPHLYN